MRLSKIKAAVGAAGLAWRGAFHPEPEDLPDGEDAGTLVLLGFVGCENWAAFAASPEAVDSAPDPLDRWSRRVISALAAQFGARPYFPFGGPPWAAFISWAQKAEPVHRSAIGMLIHPDYGLWHAWRGALAFRDRLNLPPPDLRPSPCDACDAKPCLKACPVDAFTPVDYNLAACNAHLSKPEGADCISLGCRARRACPVGASYRYGPGQAAFHMRAFANAASR